ncbi:hypothetical protein D3C85_1594700 [compost metagenome]
MRFAQKGRVNCFFAKATLPLGIPLFEPSVSATLEKCSKTAVAAPASICLEAEVLKFDARGKKFFAEQRGGKVNLLVDDALHCNHVGWGNISPVTNVCVVAK